MTVKLTDVVYTMDIEESELPQLTDKQLKFVMGKAEGMTNTEAYKAAYNTVNMKPSSIWTNSSQLASDTKVAQWIEYAKRQAAERLVDLTSYTLEVFMAELEDMRQKALAAGAYGPATSMTVAKGKACNHMSDNNVTTHVHTADRSMLDRIEQTMGTQARLNAEQSLGIKRVEH